MGVLWAFVPLTTGLNYSSKQIKLTCFAWFLSVSSVKSLDNVVV